jgi:hypothetical protein
MVAHPIKFRCVGLLMVCHVKAYFADRWNVKDNVSSFGKDVKPEDAMESMSMDALHTGTISVHPTDPNKSVVSSIIVMTDASQPWWLYVSVVHIFPWRMKAQQVPPDRMLDDDVPLLPLRTESSPIPVSQLYASKSD